MIKSNIDILSYTLGLSMYEKKQLVKKLLQNIVATDHNNISSEFASNIKCPYCKSTTKVKNGKLNARQRYLCKNCNKSYTTLTNTPISYSKKEISLWEKYIELLLSCEPLRKTATLLNISLSTAFYWRHKLLDALRENSPSNPKLSNSVKILELYIRESFKGSAPTTNRTSHKTGEKRSYKFISKNDVCILIAKDNKNTPIIEMSCLNKPTDETLEVIFDNNIESGSAIITDKWIPYKRLADKNGLIYVPHLNKYHKARAFHSKNITPISQNITEFIAHFQGVATKYLENYLCLYKSIFYFTSNLSLNLHTSKQIKIKDYKFRKPTFK